VVEGLVLLAEKGFMGLPLKRGCFEKESLLPDLSEGSTDACLGAGNDFRV
jgi:hypothetical protein